MTSPAASMPNMGLPLAYHLATPTQLTQALAYLRHRLHQHFPTLTEPTWMRALEVLQPEFWVAGDQLWLDYYDLEQLTQHLATSAELPQQLDPPIYGAHALYLAQLQLYLAELAVWVLPELEANPSTCGPRLYQLVSLLARGNGTASRVVQAMRWGFAMERPLPPGLPGGGPAPGSTPVEKRLVRLGRASGHLPPKDAGQQVD